MLDASGIQVDISCESSWVGAVLLHTEFTEKLGAEREYSRLLTKSRACLDGACGDFASSGDPDGGGVLDRSRSIGGK